MVKLRPRDSGERASTKLAASLYEAIPNVYRVEIELPWGIRKESTWKLEVVNKRGKKMKGVKVAYPSLLVPGIEPATD